MWRWGCWSTRSAVQVETVTQAESEDLAKVTVECGFDDWAGGAKTALVVADSARGSRSGRRAPGHKGNPCRWAGRGVAKESRGCVGWREPHDGPTLAACGNPCLRCGPDLAGGRSPVTQPCPFSTIRETTHGERGASPVGARSWPCCFARWDARIRCARMVVGL
jgi:hypothetical protein